MKICVINQHIHKFYQELKSGQILHSVNFSLKCILAKEVKIRGQVCHKYKLIDLAVVLFTLVIVEICCCAVEAKLMSGCSN